MPEAFSKYDRTVFLKGYWQSEAYFSEIRQAIGGELRPPRARSAPFAEMARRIEACNSVAVGVRLFEEIAGANKEGVGGLVEMPCYDRAARRLCEEIDGPEFFVFCTSHSPALGRLNLPGPVHLLTHDDGYEGTIECLWLFSRCRNHIISNSSFYWWGAWLAEFERPETRIVAIDKFPNSATVPSRWLKIRPQD